MIQEIHTWQTATVIYQDTKDETEPIAEPAIIVSTGKNDDLICLSQEGRDILINIGTMEEVIKTMRSLAKNKKTKKK